MIDTIVLALAQDVYYISEPHKFTPSAQWILTKSAKRYTGIQSKQNPTKTELLTGVYKPRLTLAHRKNFLFDRGLNRQTHDKLEPMLKIEFSAPKLIYDNNFSKLQYKDFKQVIEKLATVLKTMGVIVTPQTLAKSPVLAIHYSKNILLTDAPHHTTTLTK